MLKAKRYEARPKLSLVHSKPEPDTRKDAELLDSILENGFTHTRYLSIDCVGGERASEKRRYSVTLACHKMELHLFFRSALGPTPLSEAGEARISSIMMDAEDEGLVRLRQMK